MAKQPACTPKRKNPKKEEYQALESLKHNYNITIKKQTKVLIQNTSDYISEGEKHLSNQKFYRQLTYSLTVHYTKLVNDLIDELQNKQLISEETASYLQIKKPHTACIYFNPKIHKLKNPPPGRPNVSANNSCSERISGFVDHFLKDYVDNIPSFIQDSTDFINKLMKVNAPPQSLLVTIDVISLYTNIQNIEALRVVKNTLKKNRHIDNLPSNMDIVRLLALVLRCKNFEFNEKHYLHINGVALGTNHSQS